MAEDAPPPPPPGRVFYPDGYIPRRDDDLSPHFTDPRHVNAAMDSTAPVTRYSARRRVLAVAATAVMGGWMAAGVVSLADLGTLGAWKLYLLLFRGALAVAVVLYVWRWANRPVGSSPAVAG